MSDLPDYVVDNRKYWDREAPDWVEAGERAWKSEPSWGIWAIPESQLSLLPRDMSGMRAIELGCGTGYVSAWMVRRGATCVGIDNSENQLATARRLAAQNGIDLELIHGNAETAPYPDESFEFAVSEYGAAIWADPYKWIPEAWRLLVPGGELIFLGHHPFLMVAARRSPPEGVERRFLWSYFDLHKADWTDPTDPTTEFNLTISGWMRLFHDVGFEVIEYHELRNPDPAAENRFHVDPEWAHDYPSEQVWRLRKV